jgi:hypothetical protein
LFNEISIIVVTYHLYLFTDFIESYELKYNIGWSLIAFISFNIFVNLAITAVQSYFSIKLTIKNALSKCRKRRNPAKKYTKTLNESYT